MSIEVLFYFTRWLLLIDFLMIGFVTSPSLHYQSETLSEQFLHVFICVLLIGGFSVLFRTLLVDWKVHRLMKADDEELNKFLKTQIVKDYPAPRRILTEHRIAIISVIKFINAEHCRSHISIKQSSSLRLLAACACVIATSITGFSLFFKIDLLRSQLFSDYLVTGLLMFLIWELVVCAMIKVVAFSVSLKMLECCACCQSKAYVKMKSFLSLYHIYIG